MKKYSDMICGGMGIIIALVMFGLSIEISIKENNAIGAAFMPQIVAGIVIVFSAVLLWRGWQSSKVYAAAEEAFPSNTKSVMVMMVSCLLYACLLKPVGFIIDSLVFLFLSLCLMTKKEETNYVKLAIITGVAVMAIYLIFTQFFGIRLPSGIL